MGYCLLLWLTPCQWEATALVNVNFKEFDRLQDLHKERYEASPPPYGAWFYPTELELIYSKVYLYSVIEKLNLVERWNQHPHHKQPLEQLDAYLILKRYLVVVPLRDVDQIQVQITTASETESAEIANAIATTYVKKRQDSLVRETGIATSNRVSVRQLAISIPRTLFPLSISPWAFVGAAVLVGGTGVFLLSQRK
jgi:hypothetical protein